MELLQEQLRSRLPPLLSQETSDEPVVICRYLLHGTRWAWYVIEGESEDDDFLFFGFVTGLDDEFGHFRLSDCPGPQWRDCAARPRICRSQAHRRSTRTRYLIGCGLETKTFALGLFL